MDPVKTAVIIGSIRAQRFAPVVARWFERQCTRRDDMTFDVVDLAATPLPAELPGFGEQPSAVQLERLRLVTPRLTEAEAFVVVTPEYNHSYPASLKAAIDWHNDAWHAKPVAFVSYGGISGGLRAVEHLRGVFAELHAFTIRAGVSFTFAPEQFGSDGEARDQRKAVAAQAMLDQLGWTARALRTARREEPYPAL